MTLYALFDCNSFYANCERLFRPDLRHRPIVVLSNNDGCVIARCRRARQWVQMGALYHEVRPLLKRQGVAVFKGGDRKSTRLNSSHVAISYPDFCLKKNKT